MKSVKFKKSLLNKTPEHLLRFVGAVDEKNKMAFPEHVYISDKDYKTLYNNIKKLAKKDFPYMKAKEMELIAGMEMLNLGPNQSLGNVIVSGNVLVDVDAIENEKKSLSPRSRI